ncbi:unnamed protein product [Rangifer tarandus platyrhynchus]|uniref:Uncharacterized protein n=1 Tax=Rangifer tarandus platyrhynchus TaxID=3082113 RepID=A0AC59ZPN7_RANTA
MGPETAMCRSQASPGLEEKPEAVSLRPGGDPTVPTTGVWVCALSPAPLKAFLALDPAQFLQQEGPGTPLRPRAPRSLVCIFLMPAALEALPGGQQLPAAQTQAEVGHTIWRKVKEGRSVPCSLLKGLEGKQWPRVGSAWASLSALPDTCPPLPSVLQGDRGGRGRPPPQSPPRQRRNLPVSTPVPLPREEGPGSPVFLAPWAAEAWTVDPPRPWQTRSV